MSGSTSVVHAFVQLGLSEHDAWRCAHLMQGKDSVVLLRVERHGAEPACDGDAPPVDPNQLVAVRAGGACLTVEQTGGWQYIRGLRWSIEQVEELCSDLNELTHRIA